MFLDTPKEPSLVLILKWGGELTPAGRVQAEELGRSFRCMYPGGQGMACSAHLLQTCYLNLFLSHAVLHFCCYFCDFQLLFCNCILFI